MAWILRCPHAGQVSASLATVGAIVSTTGAGHGPVTGSPFSHRDR